MDNDNTYIGLHLKYKYINVSDIAGQPDDHIEQYSFLQVDNYFTPMSFGGCPREIYGGTLAETSHAALLGLCQYVAEGMELILAQSILDQISYVVVGIYNDSR